MPDLDMRAGSLADTAVKLAAVLADAQTRILAAAQKQES